MAENLRLLVVDDEKDIVQAYVDILAPTPVGTVKKSSRGAPAPASAAAPSDYEIFRAHSGEEAVAILKAQFAAGEPVAGAFFDVKMDGALDGIQAAKAAFDLDPRIQVTIVTAYQDRSVQDIDSLFGPAVKDQWDYLNKPFNSGEIVQKARHMTAAWNRREELRRTQALLVESERMAAIGQVARGVGHEFGNILQRIVGRADIAMGGDEAKMKQSLEVILQAAENAAVIVQNLQAFSRKESPKKAVDVAKIITDALTLLHHDLHKGSIKIENKLTAVPPVNGSVVELGQVFVNLLINAMHAIGGKGGTVEVGTRLDGGNVVAWVKDSGTGIPADVLPRIFEYAFTTKGDKGSGLGLSISKQIIEGHGGAMAAQSAPGQGALFTISLPAGGKAP